MTPKRSIIYDEMGERLGRGRKSVVDGRTEVRSPKGVSPATKKLALERAKAAVINRHFAEVIKLCNNELEFLKALDEWVMKQHGHDRKISEFGSDLVLQATREYYTEFELDKPQIMPAEDHKELKDGSIEEPMLLRDGRPRPRPKKSA